MFLITVIITIYIAIKLCCPCYGLVEDDESNDEPNNQPVKNNEPNNQPVVENNESNNQPVVENESNNQSVVELNSNQSSEVIELHSQ